MGSIVLAVVIAFFIIMIVILFLLFLLQDIRSAQIYRKAGQSIGKVKRQLEDKKINAYGSGIVGMRRRIYYLYEVDYEVQGKTYTGILWTKKKNLDIGAEVNVRYARNKDTNEIELVTSVCADRLKELLIGGIIGVLFAAAIIILKMNGMICKK